MKKFDVFMHFVDDSEKRFKLRDYFFERPIALNRYGGILSFTDEGERINLRKLKYIEIVNISTNEVEELDEEKIKGWLDSIPKYSMFH